MHAALDQLAQRLVMLSEAGYIRPRTFLGVASMKIFRDDIWSDLRVVFRADTASSWRSPGSSPVSPGSEAGSPR